MIPMRNTGVKKVGEKERAEARVEQFMSEYPEMWQAILGLEAEPENCPNVLALLQDAQLYELAAILEYRYKA